MIGTGRIFDPQSSIFDPQFSIFAVATLRQSGEAEVDDPALAGRIYHNVGRFHVAVQDVDAVGVVDRFSGVGQHFGDGAEVGVRE